MRQELNLQEMNKIKGGIPIMDYCDILLSLWNEENLAWWNIDQVIAWEDAFIQHCINL